MTEQEVAPGESEIGGMERSGFALSPRARADAAGYLPPMVTRAQNFEDVILRRALQDIESGFYVDIGAWRPVQDSVTAWFYAQGWQGINVEPNPDDFAALEQARTRDLNLKCVVGACAGPKAFTLLKGTGLSSGAPGALDAVALATSAQLEVISVPQVTLDHVLSLAGNKVVDFLKIDAEGMEADILNAASFELNRPRIVVVEATEPNTQRPCHEPWEGPLLAKGYALALFDGLNRFYVRTEDMWRKPIFATPPGVFDNFMAATRAADHRDLMAALATLAAEQKAATERATDLEHRLLLAQQRVETLEAALTQTIGRRQN